MVCPLVCLIVSGVALTLQQSSAEGLPTLNLTKLRTEIILKDENHVVFWFSFSFKVAINRQQRKRKRALPPAHQTRVRPETLFPKRRAIGEQIPFGEDEARTND